MKLGEARCRFSACLGALILRMNEMPGYRAAFAEVMDRKTVKDPTTDHMAGSLHEIGLAADIDLYVKRGDAWIWCEKTEDHQPFGEYWETMGVSLGLPLAWGGRFRDGNHYSLAWEGKK